MDRMAVRVIAHAASSTTLAIAKRIVESSSAGTALTPSLAAIHCPPMARESMA
jgi:cysteine synthase